MNDFELSLAARQDLIEIWEFIAANNIDMADRVRDRIFQAMERLAERPEMGHLREDLIDKPLRFWRVYSYLILYRSETRPLEIVRVVSGYRNISSLLLQ